MCPAGKSLCRKGQSRVVNGYVTEQLRGAKRDREPCALRKQCSRAPDTTPVRNVAFGRSRVGVAVSHTEQLRRRIDTDEGRQQYAQRVATVGLVHNIEKLAQLQFAAGCRGASYA